MPERELQLRPAAYSRQWENARLSALYRMARGDAPVVVTTAAALVQRCLSREVLLSAAFLWRWARGTTCRTSAAA